MFALNYSILFWKFRRIILSLFNCQVSLLCIFSPVCQKMIPILTCQIFLHLSLCFFNILFTQWKSRAEKLSDPKPNRNSLQSQRSKKGWDHASQIPDWIMMSDSSSLNWDFYQIIHMFGIAVHETNTGRSHWSTTTAWSGIVRDLVPIGAILL